MTERLEWNAKHDAATDTVEIFGIHYSVELFRQMALAPLNSVFRIVSREDGAVTLQIIIHGN